MALSTELFTNVASAAPMAGGGQLVSGDGSGAQKTGKREGKAFADHLVEGTDEKAILPEEGIAGKSMSSDIVILNALKGNFGKVEEYQEPETGEQADIQTRELSDTDGSATDVVPEDQVVPAEKPTIAEPAVPVLLDRQNNISIFNLASTENTAEIAPKGQNTFIDGQKINVAGEKSGDSPLLKKDITPTDSPKPDTSNILPKPAETPVETLAGSIPAVMIVTGQNVPVTENPAPAVASQQAVIAAIPIPGKPEKTEGVKEIDVKDVGKGRSDSVEAGRYQVVDHKKESSQDKGSSQNSGRDFTQTSGNNAQGVSNKASGVADPASISTPKTSFLTEASQVTVGTEGRVTQTATPQLATGLLSIQEVGQGANQHLSQANGLTQTGHVRPQMLNVDPQMVAKQISMAIAKQAGDGQESFRITLKPAELGQVDIKMNFLADGKVATTVVVESERTLHMLQRDQGSLVKILENAGFDAGGNSLNFTLKEQQQQDMGQFGRADKDSGEAADHDFDQMPALSNSIISHQQMKMAYSDNLLDINI